MKHTNNHRVYLIAGILALLLLGVGAFAWLKFPHNTASKDMPQDGKTIYIVEDGFIPDSLSVPVGTTLRFVNKDEYWHWPASDPHPSHTFYSELDPKTPVKPGGTWSVTLTKTGKWGIHDHLSPYIIGTVEVTP